MLLWWEHVDDRCRPAFVYLIDGETLVPILGGVKNSIDLNPLAELAINWKFETTAALLWDFDVLRGYERRSLVPSDELEELGTFNVEGSLSAYAVEEPEF